MPALFKYAVNALCLLFICLALSVVKTDAATYVVNTNADANDTNTADGVCDSDSVTAGDQCTLRAAIQQSNAVAGLDTINFNIAPGGQQTITILVSTLGSFPDITDPVVLDATTQPGFSPNNTPIIELTCNTGNTNGTGFRFNNTSTTASTVRGFVINRCSSGIFIQGSGGAVQVKGNYIGTDVTGNSDLGNGYGVVIQLPSPNNLVGGNSAADRNLISGNDFVGIYLFGAGAGNVVTGNYIGTNAAGTAALLNGNYGLLADNTSNVTIGGAAAGEGNLISGNGIGLFLNSSSNDIVQGNKIGTDVTGASALPNTNNGVYIQGSSSSSNIIGGTTSGAGNIIAFNTGKGVNVLFNAGTGNSIRGNSIFSNTSLGIDLANDNVTANDTLDPDTGPNNLQNYPTLTYDSANRVVLVTFNSTASTNFNIDFYSNAAADPSGFGEGQTYISTRNVTTDASGNASFGVTFPVSVPVGQYVTATATRTVAPLDTSEFSNAVQITTAPTSAYSNISGRITTSDDAPLAGTTLTLNGTESRRTITDSQGYYHFDNLETNGFYTVTPSRANYTFSPANLSFSLPTNKTDASFSANETAQTANPLDTDLFFVRQHYLDFLSREPDSGGLEYWASQIDRCQSDADCLLQARISVSAAYFMSEEFQDTGSFVYRLYKGGLGKQIGYQEFSKDRQQVVGGSNLGESKAAFADAFVQRPEFLQKYRAATTAEAFTDALISNLWDSSGVDLAAERNIMLAIYGGGSNMHESRSLVLRYAIENRQFRDAEYNKSFVLMQYFGYLKRDADEGGYLFWLNVLNNREPNNYRGMVCSFITSAEYQKRFASVITSSNQQCGN